MLVKDKLYKHHRSKVALLARNFSIAFSSFVALVALIAIPTYFSAQPTQAAEAKNLTQVTENSNSEVEDNEPLTYSEK